MNLIHGSALSQSLPRCCFAMAASFWLVAGSASAQTTYVVDDDGGPGVDFVEIQGALDVAGFSDVVEVRAGSYSSFSMTTPTRLLGELGAHVENTSEIVGIAGGEWTVLAGLQLDRLRIQSCAGTVILDDVELVARSLVLDVRASTDVRGRRVRNRQSSLATLGTLVSVDASNLQLSDSRIRCFDADPDRDGDTAVGVRNGAFLHLTDCTIRGSRGGDSQNFLGSFAGRGGDGIHADDSSSTRIVRSEVSGGGGGYDNINVLLDGQPGSGLNACGGAHDVWASLIEGGDTPGGTYSPGDDFRMNCGAELQTNAPLPSLTQVGDASPGLLVILEARAQFLSSGRLIFGRSPVRVSVPGSTAPRLVDVGRLASLGSMPQGELIPIQLSVPAWPRGTVVFMQTSQTIGADTQMANAVAVVVR